MQRERINVQVYSPSTYQGKKNGSQLSTEKHYQRRFPQSQINVTIDARKFPSGHGSKRDEQPIGISNAIGIEYAKQRVLEYEEALIQECHQMQEGVEYVIVAQESFLKFHLEKFGFYDHTAAAIKNLTTGEEGVGVSDGVRFPMRDIIATAFKPGGFRENTVGRTYAERMLRDGVSVNPQDPYPSMGHLSRDIYLEQAPERAYQSIENSI